MTDIAGQGPPTRERPPINTDVSAYWEGVARHSLLVQRCDGCQMLRFPFVPACSRCGSLDWQTVEASGRGHLYSFVVVHHPPLPGFEMPFHSGLVELEEGVRMVGLLHVDEGVPVEIGAPVQVEFVDDAGFTYADFRVLDGIPRGDR